MLEKGSSAGCFTVFLIEDDARLSELVQEYLTREGYEVTVIADGADAAKKIPSEQPDMVILDIMLPGMDGFDICKSVRPHYRGPILMMTARSDELDEILGLEMGADDYVTKPVRPRLLLSRVKALLRRATPTDDASRQVFQFGELTIDLPNRRVQIAGASVDLTTAEFDLLHLLAEHVGEPMDRDQLSQVLRGIEYDGLDRTIDLRVARLRKKIEPDPAHPRYVVSVRGTGYQLLPDPTTP